MCLNAFSHGFVEGSIHCGADENTLLNRRQESTAISQGMAQLTVYAPYTEPIP